MPWDFCVNTTPTARKNYECGAMVWIDNASEGEDEYDPEDWALIEKARSEGSMILKGQRYIKVSGKWEGEMSVFRARPEIHEICIKYDVYCD